MAAIVARDARVGSGSIGSVSDFTGPPTRWLDQPVKLCATNRRAPAPRAAASRCSVPSMRSRLVRAKDSSNFFTLVGALSALSSCTTTSGTDLVTAFQTDSGSRPSMTTGSAPIARSASSLSADWVLPVTSCPAPTSLGTRHRPTAPLAPATKTITSDSHAPHLRLPLRRLLRAVYPGEAPHMRGVADRHSIGGTYL